MPRSQECLGRFFHQPFDPTKFQATEAGAVFEPYQTQPEFRRVRLALYMNMWRLVTIG